MDLTLEVNENVNNDQIKIFLMPWPWSLCWRQDSSPFENFLRSLCFRLVKIHDLLKTFQSTQGTITTEVCTKFKNNPSCAFLVTVLIPFIEWWLQHKTIISTVWSMKTYSSQIAGNCILEPKSISLKYGNTCSKFSSTPTNASYGQCHEVVLVPNCCQTISNHYTHITVAIVTHGSHRWLSARQKSLQCVSNGVTAVLC